MNDFQKRIMLSLYTTDQLCIPRVFDIFGRSVTEVVDPYVLIVEAGALHSKGLLEYIGIEPYYKLTSEGEQVARALAILSKYGEVIE